MVPILSLSLSSSSLSSFLFPSPPFFSWSLPSLILPLFLLFCTSMFINGLDSILTLLSLSFFGRIPEFLSFTSANNVPVDFVSTHEYPTDVSPPLLSLQSGLSLSSPFLLFSSFLFPFLPSLPLPSFLSSL